MRSSARTGFRQRHRVSESTPGFAIDITGWDFDEPDREAEAFQLKETVRPKLLVGSSECKAWSQLQNLSKDKQPFEAEKARAFGETSGSGHTDVPRTGG